jgi:hypothetical protein
MQQVSLETNDFASAEIEMHNLEEYDMVLVAKCIS